MKSVCFKYKSFIFFQQIKQLKMLRDRIYCLLPLCMERATEQTRSIQVRSEIVPGSGVIVELMGAGATEIKTVKPRG